MTGPTTVVGFGGQDVPETGNLAEFREELVELIREHGAQVLAFDLTGVQLLPSGLLGLLASMRRQGVEVHLYNPSDDVRDVLSTTHLDQIMPVFTVDVEGTRE